MQLLFSKLEKITGGTVICLHADKPVTALITDSRKASAADGALFLAIKGARHDGHQHIRNLYDIGVRQFVIEREIDINLPEANIIRVNSTVNALQDIAAYHREQFSLPVIGITGSNGKTIVKEWLYQLLSKDFAVVKNPGSYNSQTGVPLSVWQIRHHHQLGVFEAGISQPGEMKKLERVIRPSAGIFTNIGSAHDEGFANLDEKIEEKLLLFSRVGILIYCADHTRIHHAVKKKSTIPTLSWGYSGEADIMLHQVANQYTVQWNNQKFNLTLPFADKASVENCFHCIAMMLWLKIPVQEIQQRVNTLQTVAMRLELKEAINRCQVIDDTYNNDLGGLKISLDFLAHQHQKQNKRLILSDILQSGMSDHELVAHIAALVEKSPVNAFTGIGPVLMKHKHLFKLPAEFHPDTETYLQTFDSNRYHDEVILVKGARAFQFEKIIHRLQRKVHGTIMKIDLGALVHNLNFIRSRLKPETKIMVMVKAFAYGSGSIEVANLLQYHKVNYLGVAYADEGVELRKNNISLPVMVMNPSEESFDQLLAYHLEPEIYNFKILHALIHALSGRACMIHLKLDTGMHRLGFEETDLDELTTLLQQHSNLRIASIFSHLAGADEAVNDDFSREQARKFMSMAENITKRLSYKPLYHIANSPAILRLAELQMDMVRLGIGLYGVNPTHEDFPLRPAATLKTIISQIREVNEGETIGYGRKGRATKKMKIATIAIGYADGFSRAFSNGVGEVLIHGKRAPVVGIVCMDMTMVDITGIDAREGDEVIVFGEDLPITEVAAKINTIPYEILTSTSERVKRVFVSEGI